MVIQVFHFWLESLRSHTSSAASYHVKRHMTPSCLITGDIDFAHLVSVVFARFLHYKINYFLFWNNKYLVEKYIETV